MRSLQVVAVDDDLKIRKFQAHYIQQQCLRVQIVDRSVELLARLSIRAIILQLSYSRSFAIEAINVASWLFIWMSRNECRYREARTLSRDVYLRCCPVDLKGVSGRLVQIVELSIVLAPPSSFKGDAPVVLNMARGRL